MTDAHLLRTTLDAIDDLVERLRGSGGGPYRAAESPARLVIDEGRAAAEWAIDLELGDRIERVGLLIVCDVAGDRLTDARLYVAPPATRKD
jgi:hypothetical protein